MARPEKHTADYFPFYVKDGRTLFILESKYGCRGTGFFTNVLRFLCDTPDHHYCIRNESDRLFFFSKTKCDEESGTDMLGIMAATGKLIAPWWETRRIIYSPDLVRSIRDAYRSRRNALLTEEEIAEIYGINPPGAGFPLPETHETHRVDDITGTNNPQKRREKKKKNSPVSPLTQNQQERFNRFWSTYPNRKSKGQAERAFCRLDPDEQLLAAMTAAIERAKTQDPQWLKDQGAFIPHPATWLNARGWEDELPVMGQGGPGLGQPQMRPPSPYERCPSCGKEVLRGEFIVLGGRRFCTKCPEYRTNSRAAIGIVEKIGLRL